MHSFLSKHKLSFRFVTIFTMLAFLCVTIAPLQVLAAVSVSAGTIVPLRTASTISSSNVNMGDTIDLTVTSDVVVDGKVVIKAGAIAKGEVTNTKKKGILGSAGELSILVREVTAVDNSKIFLSGTRSVSGDDKMVVSIILGLLCVLGFFMKGGEAVIPAGTQINASVVSTVSVSI